MPKTVIIGNLSASANTNISLKGYISEPIFTIVSAVVLQGHAVNEGGTATYNIFNPVSATATKVDNYTISLNVAIATTDVLQLTYVGVTEKVAPS